MHGSGSSSVLLVLSLRKCPWWAFAKEEVGRLTVQVRKPEVPALGVCKGISSLPSRLGAGLRRRHSSDCCSRSPGGRRHSLRFLMPSRGAGFDLNSPHSTCILWQVSRPEGWK